MMAKRNIGILYLLILFAVISALAWPAFVVSSTLLAYLSAEGWQLDAWSQLPKQLVLQDFLTGYEESLIFSVAVGLIAVLDYLLLSRYRITWMLGGILLPITGAALAFAFYKHPMTALPSLALAGLLLALVHRLIDILAGSTSRGRLR